MGYYLQPCVRKISLYDWERSLVPSETIQRSTSVDIDMICCICGVQLKVRIRTQELHQKLGIVSLPERIRSCRLRYFGHLQRMDKNAWSRRVNNCMLISCHVHVSSCQLRVNDLMIPGSLPRCCPHLRWSDVIRKELADNRVQFSSEIE